jgi:hypothetical protein
LKLRSLNRPQYPGTIAEDVLGGDHRRSLDEIVGWALTTALVVVLVSCTAPRPVAALTPGNGQEEKHMRADAVGVWEGVTVAVCPGSPASRCSAQQKVTITLVKGANSQLGGSYKCAYGNMNCLNMNQTGKVADVDLTGQLLRLRALMPDGMSCLFSGRIADGNINGGYSCKVTLTRP